MVTFTAEAQSTPTEPQRTPRCLGVLGASAVK